MSEQSGVTLKWPLLILLAVLLVAAGAGGSYLVLRARSENPPATVPVLSESRTSSPSAPVNTGPWPDVSIALTREALQRADLQIVTVQGAGPSVTPSHLSVSGLIQPNGYRAVKV